MQYTKTTFVYNQAPPITDVEMNKIGDALTYLAKMSCEKATFSASSTAANYMISIPNYSAPPSAELPLAIVFTPTITNISGLTATPSWGSIAYPVYDISTNAAIYAGEVKQNQPIAMLFDGSKFWVTGGGKYLKYGITAQQNGYFDQSTSTPTGDTRLNYNGYLYTVRLYGAVYNTGADVAEGYPVSGEYEFGDLVSVLPDGTYAVNTDPFTSSGVGFVSDENQYAALYGMNFGTTPVALVGRVAVKVDGVCRAGQYLCAGAVKGTVVVCDLASAPRGSIYAMALENKGTSDVGLVLAQIVRL